MEADCVLEQLGERLRGLGSVRLGDIVERPEWPLPVVASEIKLECRACADLYDVLIERLRGVVKTPFQPARVKKKP